MDRVINDIHLANIGNSLRETLGEDSQFIPEDMSEAIKRSNEITFSNGYETGFSDGDELGYQAGLEQGYNDGRNDGIEAGKKAQHEAFWNAYLKHSRENNASTLQVGRFTGSGWNDDTFYPTQDIYVKYGYHMFFYNRISNIKQRLEDCGVKLIFDGCNDVGSMFEGCSTTEIPTIEMNKVSKKDQVQRLCCACSKLVTIEKIIADEGNLWGNSFNGCSKLENVVFEGVIGKSISFSSSPLTVASMKSIISCLKDYTGTTSEFTQKVTFSSACVTALEAEGATSPNGNTWTEYLDDIGWLCT